MSNLEGIITAIPTPLMENEDVDTNGLCKVLDYCLEEGASGIFILGSMGEGPALLDSQKKIAVKTAVEHINGSVPLLAGIADVSTRRMIEMGKAIRDLQPDYLVITTPYYYRFPHPDSLLESVCKITDALDYPAVFYHCPGATGNMVPLETILKIANIPHIKAIKDSSCQPSLVMELLRTYPDKETRPCSILQGDESVYDVTLLAGADGVITGGGTVFISTLVQLYKAAKKGDRLEAFRLQQKFSAQMKDMLGPELLTDWMYAIKTKLKEKGLCDNFVTSPFMKRPR